MEIRPTVGLGMVCLHGVKDPGGIDRCLIILQVVVFRVNECHRMNSMAKGENALKRVDGMIGFFQKVCSSESLH